MKSIKFYRMLYICIIASWVILSFVSLSIAGKVEKFDKTVSIVLQQILIIVAFGGVVGVLHYSKVCSRFIKSMDDYESKLKKYSRLLICRILAFSLIVLFALFVYIFSGAAGILMIIPIVFLLSFFILPSVPRFIQETGIGETDDEEKEHDK